ncbi:hypothetical protein BAE44_0004990 [Dichanthelium oligosanthes]|uniref:Uncharacterized protein n=1 Tax=Dichanthelium oligosanthes TaxID=888268 RepID=A0A1E5W9A0_9POAL|nr:hypothetical protein BAE44_0004990 [Dichanthelium oligosanthes]
MQRRAEFSFPGSPARGLERALPPRPAAPRYGEEEVRWLQASRQASPDHSSGGSSTPSPQLWAYHPDHNHQHQHHLMYPASAGSSPSRAQAIAGYRREMLDLVRGLPESAYELSLRDIVEHPAAASSSCPPPEPLPPPSDTAAQQHHTDTPAAAVAHGSDEPAGNAVAAAGGTADVEEGRKQSASGKKQGRRQRMMMRKQRSRSLERSVSLDTGLLIKLFLPLSIGGKKKKANWVLFFLQGKQEQKWNKPRLE